MGKAYFEFLEEEFQGLTSQLQEALKRCIKDNTTDSAVDIPLLFTRCHAIYQQMRAEVHSQRKPEFRDRLTLYSIQLTALLEHYRNFQFVDHLDAAAAASTTTATTVPHHRQQPKTPQQARQEVTFTFTIDDDDNML